MKDTSAVAAKVKQKQARSVAAGREQEVTDANLEMGRYGIMAILTVGGVAGLFGMLFLLGGLISSGSPLNFVSQWVKAVFGG